MSTPINHHYVSQCQLRCFFNEAEGRIYLYDKHRDNIFDKKTTKTVFSEPQLNSTYLSGEVNHSVVEDDLRFNLEESYAKNLKLIETYITTGNADVKVSEDQFIDALSDMIRLGVIGELRHPVYKKDTDDQIFGMFTMLARNATPELKQELEEVLENNRKTKYSNRLTYSQTSTSLLALMGSVHFNIFYIAQGEDMFLVSDCSAIASRAKINEYFNPDIKEIAVVTMPISSNIMVMATSDKLEDVPGKIFYFTDENRLHVEALNHATLANTKKMIACKSETYLRAFIRRQKTFFVSAGLNITTTYIM